jgi:hypothetical protein
MSDEKQNGKPVTPAMPQLPEGEIYLFVRLNPKTQEFSCLFSDPIGGLAMIPLAGAHITNTMIQPAPALDVPPESWTPKMLAHFKKGGRS